MTLDWLTPELDKDLREYCAYLSPDDGEDGYHDAIVNLLTQKAVVEPIRPQAYLRVAVKCAVYKIWRHRKAEDSQVEAYARGDAPDHVKNLKHGRLPHTHCRRGHEFTVDNTRMVGTQRTCQTCFLERRRNYQRQYRAKQKKGI